MTVEAAAPTTEQTQTPEGPATAPSLLGDNLYEVPQKSSPQPEPVKEAKPQTEDPGEPEEKELEPVAGKEPGEGEEESEESTISSLNEWIAQLATDPDKASRIKVPVKVDGKPAEATVSDLVKSYQIGAAAEKRLEEAKEVKVRAQQEAQSLAESLNGQLSVAAKLIENAETVLNRDTANINWSKLREDDPAEYSARKTEISERRQEIEKLKREAIDSYQKSVGQYQQKVQEHLKSVLPAEQQALVEKLPELRDPEKAKAWKNEIHIYAKGLGFTDQDVNSVMDHRILVLADKARRWDELQSNKIPAAKKKLEKVPKVLKPGTGSNQQPRPKPKDPAEILYGG